MLGEGMVACATIPSPSFAVLSGDSSTESKCREEKRKIFKLLLI